MSLSPQRPNFILIWIGIIMLTFSVAGDWMFGPKVLRTTDSGDFATRTEAFEDSANGILGSLDLPGLAEPMPVYLEQAYDQSVPLVETRPWDAERSLAEAGILTEPAERISEEQPQESSTLKTAPLPPATEFAGESGLVQPEKDPGVDPVPQHHSFQEAALRKRQKGMKSRPWSEHGQYNLVHGGSGSHASAVARKVKEIADRSGKEVLIRTTVIPIAKDRLMVRFGLENPEWVGQAKDKLSERPEIAERLLAKRSKDLLASMEEVLEEQPTADEEAERKKREKLKRMKAKLTTHLGQRPGGLELVAELSPAQLEALMKKLSARNPRLRALMDA